jgi:hypothetical protein
MSAVPPPSPLTRAQIEAAINGLSDADWSRLEYAGRTLAAGVTGWTGEDLLQEALTKFLEGARTWPAGVPPVVVIGNVMHSIASNERSGNEASPIDDAVEVDPLETEHAEEGASAGQTVMSTTATTPEDIVSTCQQIVAIYAAVAGDPDLENLVKLWAQGIRGEEARMELGWPAPKYEAERKRLFRRLSKLDRDRSQQ